MIRITKDLNAEVVETGDPERTEENLHKSHENYSKYSYEPVISRLGAVTFFRVSKLTHRRPESQCNPARDRNSAKGKPLLRQGADGNRSRAGDISLNGLTEAPVVFPAFAVGETPAPERSEGERGGGRTSPMSKALRKHWIFHIRYRQQAPGRLLAIQLLPLV